MELTEKLKELLQSLQEKTAEMNFLTSEVASWQKKFASASEGFEERYSTKERELEKLK